MSEERQRAEDVLRPGQFFRLAAEFDEKKLSFAGRLRSYTLRYLAVELQAAGEDYLTSPPAGTEVRCAVTGDNCVYRFAVGFRGCTRLPEHIWFLEKPETITRIQMREFVRVPLTLPARVKLPGAHGSTQNARETTLLDISGGGLAFVSTQEVLLASRIAVDIPNLPHYGRLRAAGDVRRATAVDTPAGRVYHVGIAFDGMTAREQDRLVSSVFELQRELLARGIRLQSPQDRAEEKQTKLSWDT